MSFRRRFREKLFEEYSRLAPEDHQNLDRMARFSIRAGERVSKRINAHRTDSNTFVDTKTQNLKKRLGIFGSRVLGSKPKKHKT